MFSNCSGLTNLEVENFNTSNVLNFSSLFQNCSALTSLDVSKFDTKSATLMVAMFAGCSSLTSLDLSNFDTSNVTSMEAMFSGCTNLTNLNVSSFNTSNVCHITDMQGMFQQCSSLEVLDISSFNTAKVVNMSYMFQGSSKLRTIYVGSEWSTSSVTKSINMFLDCNSLVGGDGTPFNPNYIDKTKAYAGAGGYLTLKGQNPDPDDPATGEGWYKLIDKKLVQNYSQTGEWMMFQSNGYFIRNLGKTYNTMRDAHIDPNDPYTLLYDFAPGTYDKIVYIDETTVKLQNEGYPYNAITTFTIADGSADYDHIGDNTFRAETAESVLMRFRILDEENKTCQIFAISEVGENGIGAFLSQAISTSTSGSVTIPSSVNGYTVIEIGSDAFKDCKDVTSISIPGSIVTIGVGAFAGCSSLQSINIPEGVTTIEIGAFENCSALQTASLPQSLSDLGNRAFSECSCLNFVTMPEELETIGSRVFYKCASLTSITIPLGIVNLGGMIFENCKALQQVTIPDGVTAIGDAMFRGCSALTSISLPASVQEIGVTAFMTSGLTSIELPEAVTSIGETTFYGCLSLERVKIGKNVSDVGPMAFSACVALKDFYSDTAEPPSVSANAFDAPTVKTATLHVPAGSKNNYSTADVWKYFGTIVEDGSETETIEDNGASFTLQSDNTAVFTDGRSLSGEYEIPEYVTHNGMEYQVTVIAARAFENNSGLTKVTIPKSVVSIGASAFKNCYNLGTIISYPEIPAVIALAQTRAVDSSAFDGVDKESCVLYVPDASVSAYQTADGWKEFTQIKGLSTLGINDTQSEGKPVDVYNLSGRQVLRNTTHLDELPKGVYVIKGKKIINR